jgi:hypothetical protein
MKIESFINTFFLWIETKTKEKFFLAKLIFFLVFLSLFFATPKFFFYMQQPHNVLHVWSAYQFKADHLTSSLTQYQAVSHEAKLVFRLTIPILIKLFGLNFITAYLLKFVLGVLSIILFFKITNKLLNDKVSATLLSAGLVFIYYGRSGFIVYPTFDEIAYFFILLALYVRNPWLIFLCCSIAAWTDERSFLVLPIVIIFYQIYESKLVEGNNNSLSYKNIYRLNRYSLAAFAAIVFYVALRLFLSFQYNMHTPSGGADFSVFVKNFIFLGFGIWSFYEGFWLLLFLALVIMIKNKNYLLSVAILAQLLVSIVVACCVDDITRSGACLGPLVFAFILIIKPHVSRDGMRNILLVCCFVSFVFPAYYIVAGLCMEQPIYYEAIRFVLNKIA